MSQNMNGSFSNIRKDVSFITVNSSSLNSGFINTTGIECSSLKIDFTRIAKETSLSTRQIKYVGQISIYNSAASILNGSVVVLSGTTVVPAITTSSPDEIVGIALNDASSGESVNVLNSGFCTALWSGGASPSLNTPVYLDNDKVSASNTTGAKIGILASTDTDNNLVLVRVNITGSNNSITIPLFTGIRTTSESVCVLNDSCLVKESSSHDTAYPGWKAFDRDPTTLWNTEVFQYTEGSGVYDPTHSPQQLNGTGVDGEWLVLSLLSPMTFKSVKLKGQSAFILNRPSDYKIYGSSTADISSNTGVWTELLSVVNELYDASYETAERSFTNVDLLHIAIVITKTKGETEVIVGEVYYNGL